jgi:hypothetical protein
MNASGFQDNKKLEIKAGKIAENNEDGNHMMLVMRSMFQCNLYVDLNFASSRHAAAAALDKFNDGNCRI